MLSLLAAIPAYILGLRALRAIHSSDGRLRGQRLAIAGMVLGVVGGLITASGLAILVLRRQYAVFERTACANNLRVLGLAVKVDAEQHDKRFPQATVHAPNLAAEKRLSWLATVLPYLGQQAPSGKPYKSIADRLDPTEPWDARANEADRQRLLPFLCRAAPVSTQETPWGVTSYVGLSGVEPNAAALPKTSPRAGFFGYDRSITSDDFQAGTTYTMAVVETNLDNGPWAAGGPATVRGLDPTVAHYVGPDRPFGGLHPGGANVLWGDGSVRFVSDSVLAPVFQAQATLVGSGPDVP
jgi:prepilin-type processing-associated H-X9-DG protein